MKIIFIACSAKKLKKRAKAKDLYISPLFRLNWRYANKLKSDRIYILSAKYGLVKPNTVLKPYNVTLNSQSPAQRKAWAEKVAEQMRQEKINFTKDKAIFLAGKNYHQHLAPLFRHFQLPLKGLGIGRQLKYLKNHV